MQCGATHSKGSVFMILIHTFDGRNLVLCCKSIFIYHLQWMCWLCSSWKFHTISDNCVSKCIFNIEEIWLLLYRSLLCCPARNSSSWKLEFHDLDIQADNSFCWCWKIVPNFVTLVCKTPHVLCDSLFTFEKLPLIELWGNSFERFCQTQRFWASNAVYFLVCLAKLSR